MIDPERRNLPAGRRTDDHLCEIDEVGAEDIRALIAQLSAMLDSEKQHTLRALEALTSRLDRIEERLLRLTMRALVAAGVLAVIFGILGWIGPAEIRDALRGWINGP